MELAKSASTMVSVSARAWAFRLCRNNTPATSASITTKATAHHRFSSASGREAPSTGITEWPESESRFKRCKSVRVSAADW